jgi:hypothetical protein
LFWYGDAVGDLGDVVVVVGDGDGGLNCYNAFINPCNYVGVVGSVWW